MSPDRRGVDSYAGPERRESHRRSEDRPPLKYGPFTTWQWAVLGSYFVAIVLSWAIYGLAHRADDNARAGNTAICVEAGFLRNSSRTTKALILHHPEAPETPVRQQAVKRLDELVAQLERSVPSCRSALK